MVDRRPRIIPTTMFAGPPGPPGPQGPQGPAGSGGGSGPVVATDITDSTTVGRAVLKAADAAAARAAIGAGTSSQNLPTPSQAEAEAGTATTPSAWTSQRVKQAILALAPGLGSITQDNVPDGVTAKQFTATNQTKLNGIATGATANDTDANLKNRANHTGTQSADTITDSATKVVMTSTERTKLAGLGTGGTTTAANITDASANGRSILTASTYAAMKTLLGLTDTDINAKIAAQRAADPLILSVASDQSDPAVQNGRLLVRLASPSATKSASEAFEFVTSATATSATLTPVSTATTSIVYLHVVGSQTSANVTAGRNAGYPASVTGGGRTWTLVPGTQSTNAANNQTSSAVYKGVYASGATTQDITVTMAAATTGTAPSASHDRIGVRGVEVTATTGNLAQSAVVTNSSIATSTTSLSGVNTANLVLGFVVANSISATLALSSTPAFNELTPQTTSGTGTAFRTAAAWALPGASPMVWTGSTSANKIATLLELT